MCPPVEETPVNGTNGQANGANGTNGEHPGYSAIQSAHNPHPHSKSPYKPVGDFLSNVSNFKIIESTLREGEQFAKWVLLCPLCVCLANIVSAYFDLPAKIKIARALDEFGVDCMFLAQELTRRRLTAV